MKGFLVTVGVMAWGSFLVAKPIAALEMAKKRSVVTIVFRSPKHCGAARAYLKSTQVVLNCQGFAPRHTVFQGVYVGSGEPTEMLKRLSQESEVEFAGKAAHHRVPEMKLSALR